ncbi:hypothetical protein RND81_06G020500 [Saponaria officinalis]|uniref:Growth-regulating factor n=1 Tax=Saponaria officinalis TaxID=3572 RepID=A0AAW1K6C1_SAPOF
MSSGKSSVFGDWDKSETKYHDVGLGLRLQQQQQQNQVYSSSGEELTRVVVPFTANQRQELERQTVIYKYMMASMPVPPELIIPLSKYPPLLTDHPSGRKAATELKYHGAGRGGGGDPEPWRCRRTDGKKWRCSRDVIAPDQKYCERHSQKGRQSTRSRKPVESSSLLASSTTATATTTTTTAIGCNPIVLNPFQHHPSSYDLQSSFRYPEWFMKEEVIAPQAQVLYPQQIEQFSHSDTSQFIPGNDQTTRPPPRPFIDAWSLEDVHKNKCPNTSTSMKTILPLTLSMSAGFDPENSQNNAKDDDDHGIREIRSSHQQPLNWMNSWTNMPSGGPLAEALCLGMSGTTNAWGAHSDELVSPHGHSSSSTGTTMSSKGSHASGDNSGQGFHLQ